ncbi:MAG: hypothetical protein K9M57_09680 [Phycisphaerae bacterium]|nr:hypothetical protein [Phycisphaerae bacterium]
MCSSGIWTNMSVIHPREIFKLAILMNANSIVLVHNHPSGNAFCYPLS